MPHLADVEVVEVSRVGGLVRVVARTTAAVAACPGCGAVSRRVHSRYERRLLDTAIGGCEVVICLVVRRFLCLSPECAKVTFAEQVSGLTSRYARRTPAVTAVLEAVALALDGRAGARMTGRLAAAVSRTTLIRLIRAMPDPALGASPRVLGVDEFALREGHSYGTLLVDVEARRPVDILEKRSADSFAAWLQARPGAEVICRDRAGVYSDGGSCGAPGAVQVADRWHLWHNLGEAVERAVSRHREYLPAGVAQGQATAAEPEPMPMPAPEPAPPRAGRVGDRTRGQARRHPPAAGRRPQSRRDLLDEHAAYLRERWNSGCTNAAVLWQEIRDRGYSGSRRQVRGYVARSGNAAVPAPRPAPAESPGRDRLDHDRPDRLADADRASLDAILAASPELAASPPASAPSPPS